MSRYISGTAWKRALLFASMLVLSMVTVASAITIIIDGTEEAVWTAGAGGQTPGFTNDPNEGGITDGYDIQTIRYTNDTTYFYLLIDTHATTIRNQAGPDPYLTICFNTDNNTATPGGSDSLANCDGSAAAMDGIERIVELALNTSQYDVFLGDYSTFVASSSVGDVVGAGDITEVRIPLTALGLDSGAACNGSMQMNIYLDNQVTDPDDNTPDTGTFTANCGGPTAVTLSNSMAQSHTTTLIIFAISGVLLLGLFSFSAVSRRQSKN